MSFDTYEFFDVAKSLSRPELSEGSYRTATSRAYYALHLPIRRELKVQDTGGGIHRSTIRALAKDPRGGHRLATVLEVFMRHRNAADYNLELVYTEREARQIVEGVEAALPRFREAGLIPDRKETP